MLNLLRRSSRSRADSSSLAGSDLRIHNLLDDPGLRRSMGLDAPETERPQPRFDRRRLFAVYSPAPRREPVA